MQACTIRAARIRSLLMVATRAARYAWAAPYSALGLALGFIALVFGATVQLREGALEFAGGRLALLLARLPPRLRFSAITFGHVILCIDHATLSVVRAHEQVHVRQYERWGPFFVPAYLFSSLVQLVRGRDPYRENYFEREAYAKAPERNA